MDLIHCGNAREPPRISGVIISIMRQLRLAIATFVVCFAALRSSAAIQGTVMSTDGQPLAGARVSILSFETLEAQHQRLLSANPEEVPLGTALTDAKGSFSLPSPKDAAVELTVFMRGYLPLQRRVEREEEVGAITLLKSDFQNGTITAGGKPVAKATIVLNYSGYEYVTKSGEDGKYEAPDPRRARSITVLHPDYALSEETFPPFAGGSAVRLQRALVPGSPLTGKVMGSDGKSPVEGATISLDGWPLASTGPDGSFTIPHSPAKWTALFAHKDALLGQRSFSKIASQDIRLSKGATIAGRITDTKTKLPVAGTVVSAIVPRMDRAEVSASAITDAKGGFSLLVLPATYRLVATHPAYDPKNSEAAGASGQSVSKDFALTPLARVTGTVVDESNKPVAAAAITTEDASDPMRGMARMMRFRGGATDTASGPDGRFSIRFSGDEDLRLKATRKGLPVAKSETLKLAPGERKSGVVLTIASGVAVSGRVTDREGKPLSGVAVATAEAESGRGGMQRIILSNLQQFDDDAVRTGSDGTFAMRLKEGTYDFTFKREGYATQNARAQSVTASGENVVDAKLDPAVEVRGRVVRNGSGVEGVIVAAIVVGSDSRTTTGPDGSFTLGGLTPGQVRVTLRKDDDFVQEMRSFTAPASDVVIDLPVGTRVSGRVLDKSSRKPITQFQAGLSRSRSAGGMVMMAPPQLKAFTSEDGSFTLENVPSGAHDLVTTAPGFAAGRLNINVEEGKALSGLEVELDTGTRLTGKVTGPTGAPLSDVRVNLSGGPGGAVARMGTTTNASTVTDANGEYTLEALASGDETIEFSHPKYLSTSKSVSLKGREVHLDVQLEGGQRVTGIVVTEAGVPVADAEVFAIASGASRRGVRSNASGMFEFESLAPARYLFTADKSGYSAGRVDDFDITSGVPLRITMKTGGTIYGRVSGLTPAELSNVSVDARGGGSAASANVDSSGNYRIEGAPVGTVQVAATMMSSALTGRRTTAAQTVQLDAGSARQLDFEFTSDTVIRGRVTRNGVPLKGASISFTPRTGRSLAASTGSTDEEGMYSVAGLDEAEYNVSVIDLQRFSPYTTTYQVRGSATFDIDYTANALRGRVVDAMTNAPLADVIVQLRGTEANEGFRGMRAATTDASGAFILDGVSPGSYVANASKDGYGNESRNIMIGDRPPDDLELKIARSEGVTLKVVDARGGRALDAFASVYDAQGQLIPESRMPFRMTEGAADLKLNLAPGRYTASVSAFGYATRTIAFDSPSTQTVAMTPGGTLIVRSRQSARARVRLIDSSGAPYPRSSMRPPWFDLSPSPGTTPIEHIAPGTYTLQLLGDNDSVLDTERVTIVEGQTATTEI